MHGQKNIPSANTLIAGIIMSSPILHVSRIRVNEEFTLLTKSFLTWSSQMCMMRLPGKNWNITSWLPQYPRAQCVINFAHFAPFWWTASKLMQCLGSACVIRFDLMVVRALLKPDKEQEQWQSYKLGPTPHLRKHSQLTVLSYSWSAPPN